MDHEALLPPKLLKAESHDPERVIRILDSYVTDRRRERIRTVLDARLDSVTVVFDDPYDPHNGAAVIRSSEAFGCRAIHIVEREKAFLAASSVTRGAEKWIDVYRHRSAPSDAGGTALGGPPKGLGGTASGAPSLQSGAERCIRSLTERGFALVGTHPEGELLAADLARFERVALVLGNEHAGIRPDLSAACTHFVRVPMRGFVESLNVSVTAAILLASATAGRKGDLSPADYRRLYARGLWMSVPNAEQILDATP
jgi:tRNA (guanosine-2'-O-)-methyltransferase